MLEDEVDLGVEIKPEPVLDSQTLCHACLSMDRNLFLLINHRAFYHVVCGILDTDSLSRIYLCWECLAFLSKVKSFQNKVQNAQKILNAHRYGQKPIQCLSSLATAKLAATDSNEPIEEKVEVKSEVVADRIEFELNDYLDDYDDFDDGNTGLSNVKFEDEKQAQEQITCNEDAIKKPSTVKKEKRHLTKHYRKIGNPIKAGKKTKRIAIKPQEVLPWMERERNSDFFVKLKRKCDVCLDSLGEKESLKDHQKKFHKLSSKTPFTCDICKKNFCTKNNLVVHVIKHYFVRECLTCGYQCYTLLNMKEHIRRHKRMVQCLECEATFPHVRPFFQHYKSSHIIAACDMCERKFKSKDALTRHISKSHSTTHCSHCNFTFKNRASFKLHMAMKHTIDKSEASFCVMCDIQFDNIPLFRQHVNNSAAHAHERGGKPKKERIPCPECPTTYAKKYNMLNHYRFVHANDSRFVCRECNKSFLSRTTFVSHRKRYHEGYVPEKTKLCTICGRKFSNNRTLIHHIRTHTGEKPHECTFCDAKFAQKTAMTTHIKSVHFNVRRK